MSRGDSMKPRKYVTHRCPRCQGDMLYTYRKRTGSAEWSWVLYCDRCKHEETVPEGECLLGEDDPSD